MSKLVRVENADNSSYAIIVEVWDKQPNGQPDIKISSRTLINPAQLLELTIWESRYLVIKKGL